MVANFDLNYLGCFLIDFKNSCAYLVANFLNFSKLPQLLQLGWVEADKITETKWEHNCGTPCMLNKPTIPYELMINRKDRPWQPWRDGLNVEHSGVERMERAVVARCSDVVVDNIVLESLAH